MKQTKSMVKHGGMRPLFWGMLGIVATLLLAVGLMFGMGTGTSAKAEVSDPSGWRCTVAYVQDENKVGVNYVFQGSYNLSLPIYAKVFFVSGSRRWTYETTLNPSTANNFNKTFYINLSGNEFFVGGCSYTVSVSFQDAESYETGNEYAPIYVYFPNMYTFSIPGEIVPLPEEPVEEGFHFVGWYYDESFTRPYDGAPIYADTVLYAKMEINTYTITYDTQSDVVVDSTTVSYYGVAPTPAPERTGYTFVGWFLPDGTQYTDQPITQDTTLTAQWEVKMFTVTFYLHGVVYTTMEVPYGSPLGKVMTQAKVASYMPSDSEGVRVSLQSTITEDTDVLIRELHGWEKYGNFVGRSPWYTWLWVGLGGALAIAFSVTVVLLVRARRG